MDRRRFLNRVLLAAGVAGVAAVGPGFGLALADDAPDTDAAVSDRSARRRFRARGEITRLLENPAAIELRGRTIVVDPSVNPDLSVEADLTVGTVVAVRGYVVIDDGGPQLIASRVTAADDKPDRRRFRVVGELTAWDPDGGSLAVDGREILIDADVQSPQAFPDGLAVGAVVLVAGVVVDGTRYAVIIRTGDRRRRDGQRFQLRGRLTDVGDASITIDGRTLRLVEQTQVRGELIEGRFALARGVAPPDGDPVAVHVVVLPEGVEPGAGSRPFGRPDGERPVRPRPGRDRPDRDRGRGRDGRDAPGHDRGRPFGRSANVA